MLDSKVFVGTSDWIWLALMGLTLFSFGSVNLNSERHYIGNANSLLILSIALIKIRLIVRNFMEVKTAPAPLRIALDVWLITLFGGFVYFLG